jgi:hypothetical protein
MMSEAAQNLVHEWSSTYLEGLPPRALDMAKRAAIISASANASAAVDEQIMSWALAFADYQVKLKARLMPLDSDGNVQAFENRILAFYDRVKEASERDLRNNLKPERHAGGFTAFQKAKDSLIRAGALVSGRKNRSGRPIYRRD